MTRALILTASYGSGHNTAAQSLAGAFEQMHNRIGQAPTSHGVPGKLKMRG